MIQMNKTKLFSQKFLQSQSRPIWAGEETVFSRTTTFKGVKRSSIKVIIFKHLKILIYSIIQFYLMSFSHLHLVLVTL